MRPLGLIVIGLGIQLQLLIPLVSSLSFSNPSSRVLGNHNHNKEQVHAAEKKNEEVSSSSSSSRRAMLWQMQTSPLVIGLSTIMTPTASHATAITTIGTNPSNLQDIYDDAASTYDTLYSDSIISKQLDFTSLRQNLLSKAYGNVLELGVGTGLNLPFYPPLEEDEEGGINSSNPITSYTAIDFSPNMMARAKDRFRIQNNNNSSEGDTTGKNALVSSSLASLYKEDKVSFQLGDLGNLSQLFESGKKFDTIIDTFGLCVFPNPTLVLSQAKDLLVESSTSSGRDGGGGGQLLLLEHQDSFIGKVLSPTRSLSDVSGTCRYDDDVRGMLKQAGFRNVRGKDVAGGFLLEVVAQQ